MWWRCTSNTHIKNAFSSKKKKKLMERTARSEKKIIKLSELSMHNKHKVTFHVKNFSLVSLLNKISIKYFFFFILMVQSKNFYFVQIITKQFTGIVRYTQRNKRYCFFLVLVFRVCNSIHYKGIKGNYNKKECM